MKPGMARIAWHWPVGPVGVEEDWRGTGPGRFDPVGGNHYSNPPRSSAATHAAPQQFYFWLGAEAEGFHARA